jgi:mono/diheme cytochrome c family protein
MKTLKLAAVAACVTLAGAGQAMAQRADIGEREYNSNCAVCHGMQGKGDGPYAGIIDTRVADLSTLSKRNGGVFPVQRVYEIIDGREAVRAHGPRDMPIWGERYGTEARETPSYFPSEPEVHVRARILALTEYVNRLQNGSASAGK